MGCGGMAGVWVIILWFCMGEQEGTIPGLLLRCLIRNVLHDVSILLWFICWGEGEEIINHDNNTFAFIELHVLWLYSDCILYTLHPTVDWFLWTAHGQYPNNRRK